MRKQWTTASNWSKTRPCSSTSGISTFEDVAVLKRCGNSKTVAAALAFVVPVIQAYDAKLELSVDEVIKRNEARLKALVANNEEDAKLIGELLKLLQQVLNDKKHASSTSTRVKDRPIPMLSADARAAAIALSNVLVNYAKAVDDRLKLEQDKAVLLDVGNQALEDVMNAAKRCGNSKTVAAALTFVNKALETGPTVGSMAERHKTVLRDLRTMLLEA